MGTIMFTGIKKERRRDKKLIKYYINLHEKSPYSAHFNNITESGRGPVCIKMNLCQSFELLQISNFKIKENAEELVRSLHKTTLRKKSCFFLN